MKKLGLLFSLFLFANTLVASESRAEWGLLGGFTYYSPSGVSAGKKVGPLGGLFVSHSFVLLRLEADVLYDGRKLGAGSDSAIQVPVFLRLPLFPFVNLGLGGYYAYRTASSANPSYDAGLAGSFQIRLPLAGMMSLIVDARYLYGLTEVELAYKPREFNGLVGVGFGL